MTSFPTGSMTPMFPLEIFELIISHIPDDRCTFTSLCLVSPFLLQPAQSRLCSLFRVDRWSPSEFSHSNYPPSRLLDTAEFLHCITRNTHLAPYVREFVAPFVPPEYPHRTDEEWLPLLLEALPLMTNLKSLSLFTYTSKHLTTALEAFVGCTFRLKELRWNWITRIPDQYQSTLISIFLTAQTSLQSLSLKMKHVPLLPPYALPNLQNLATTCENIVTILPRRSDSSPFTKIETLDCLHLDRDDPDFQYMNKDSPLNLPFRHVKRLCLDSSTSWWRSMESSFRELEVLQTRLGTVSQTKFYHSKHNRPTFY
jgi:hypothetical protein